MNNIIEFSALKYYNSVVSEECLYVGVLFNNLSTDTRYFYPIKNFKRLEAFDDEINITFVKYFLQSIKEEVEKNLFNYDRIFDMQMFTNTYVNEFRFTKITTMETDSPQAAIEDIKKMCLKYDFDKKSRLPKDKEKKIIGEILKSSNIGYSSTPAKGKFSENISYDFQTENYGIKIFKLKGKNLAKIIPSAKTWSYNAREMSPKKKTIFLYDMEIAESEHFNSIYEILDEHAYKVLPLESSIDVITTLN